MKLDSDVIHPKWILESIVAQRPLPLSRQYYTYMTDETEECAAKISAEEIEHASNFGHADRSATLKRSPSGKLPPIKKTKVSEDDSLAKYSTHRDTGDQDSETEEDASTESDSSHRGDPEHVRGIDGRSASLLTESH